MVRILSPANDATFFGPVDIPIFAYKVDAYLATNVEFFAGTNDLGTGFSLGVARTALAPRMPQFALPQQGITRPAADYCLVWTNVPPGSYVLTAVTKGLAGYGHIPRTSPPVNITVVAPAVPVPATNVVSIVATDPIAFAGTNSWIWTGATNAVPAWTNWPPPVLASFTNWGPKDAQFTVRRFGVTATNGVDYVTLPGSVTIPSGEAYALIPVAPIDTGDTNKPKTVILTLSSDTNSPPNYVVGIPKRAGAILLYRWLRPLPFLLPDQCFHFNAAGPDGAWFSIAYSTDLLKWTTVSTNQVLEGALDYFDGDAPGNSLRFYHANFQSKVLSAQTLEKLQRLAEEKKKNPPVNRTEVEAEVETLREIDNALDEHGGIKPESPRRPSRSPLRSQPHQHSALNCLSDFEGRCGAFCRALSFERGNRCCQRHNNTSPQPVLPRRKRQRPLPP